MVLIALAAAPTKGGAKADKGGALATLAAQSGGRALLWAVAVGLAMLVVWRLLTARFAETAFSGVVDDVGGGAGIASATSTRRSAARSRPGAGVSSRALGAAR